MLPASLIQFGPMIDKIAQTIAVVAPAHPKREAAKRATVLRDGNVLVAILLAGGVEGLIFLGGLFPRGLSRIFESFEIPLKLLRREGYIARI